MTDAEFRNDPERVKALRGALAQPIIQEAMSILDKAGPATRTIKADITPTMASIRLGAVAGWSEYATSLAQLATHPEDRDPVQSEYLRERPEDQE